MPTTLNKSAYQKLINEDIQYLLDECPRTLERDHVIQVLEWSAKAYKPDSFDGLGSTLARGIFELGDEQGSLCKRIQFKLGDLPEERDGGGLCESSLANVISELLRR